MTQKGLLEADNLAVPEEVTEEVVEEVVEEKQKDMDTTKVDPLDSDPVDAPDRPEWVPEEFWEKGAIKSDELSKAYTELLKKQKEGTTEPVESIEAYMTEEYFTEDGKFKPSGDLSIAKDDEMLLSAYDAAQKAGIGVDAANKFIGEFISQSKNLSPPEINVQEEMSKLGKNAVHVVAGIKTWIDGLEKSGSIDNEVKSKMIELGATAAGIKALNVMRQRSGELSVPTNEAITSDRNMSATDWYEARYETHAENGETKRQYHERMSKIGAKIFGTGYGTFSGKGLGL